MRKLKAVRFYVFAMLALLMLWIPSRARAEHGKTVSIINLIATPEKYHGEEVFVGGFAIL